MTNLKLILTISIGISTVLSPASLLLAQESSPPAQAPETLEEAKSKGEEVVRGLPDVIINAFKGMGNWLKNLWSSYILPFLNNVWQKIKVFLGREVEERKPEVKEEFEKEKQEMKEEIPGVSKSLWERLKDLIK
jgi:gas vesicle protein